MLKIYSGGDRIEKVIAGALVAITTTLVAATCILMYEYGGPVPEKYIIILQTGGLPPAVVEGEVPENILPESIAYNSLITYAGIPPEHITKLYDGTLDNLREWADSINKVAREEDFALVILRTHGGKGYTDIGTYEEIDKVLDLIKKPKIGVIIDSCYSGSGIESLKSDRRVIMTQTSADQVGDALSGLTPYMFKAYDPCKFTYPLFDPTKWPALYIYSKSADVSPRDGKLSLLELYDFATYNLTEYDKELKQMLPARIIREPQIWDPENLAGKIIMGQPVVCENVGPLYHGI